MGSRQDESDVVLIRNDHRPRRQIKDNSSFSSLNKSSKPVTNAQPFSFNRPVGSDTLDLFPLRNTIGERTIRKSVSSGHVPQNSLMGSPNGRTTSVIRKGSGLSPASSSKVLSSTSLSKDNSDKAFAKRKFAALQNTVLDSSGRGPRQTGLRRVSDSIGSSQLKKRKEDNLNSHGSSYGTQLLTSSFRSRGSSNDHGDRRDHEERDNNHQPRYTYKDRVKPVKETITNLLISNSQVPPAPMEAPSYRIQIKRCQIGPYLIDGPQVHIRIIDYNRKGPGYSSNGKTGIVWNLECPPQKYIHYPKLDFKSISTIHERDFETIKFVQKQREVEFLIKISSAGGKSLKTNYKGVEIPLNQYYLCMEKVASGRVDELLKELKLRKPNILSCTGVEMDDMRAKLRPPELQTGEVEDYSEGKPRLISKVSQASSIAPVTQTTISKPEPIFPKDPSKKEENDSENEKNESKDTNDDTTASVTATPKQKPLSLADKVSKLSLKAGTFCYKFPDKKSVDITEADFRSLDHMEFVNDTMINLFLRLSLFQQNDNSQSILESTHLFNTFFYDKLSEKDEYGRTSFEGAMRWTAKVDLFSKKYVIMPINESMHWYVAIIYNLPSLLKKSEKSTLSTAEDDELVAQVMKESTPELDGAGSSFESNISTSDPIIRELRNRAVDTSAAVAAASARTRSKLINIDEETPVIFILDSLKTGHSQASRKLRDFIVAELQKRKQITVNKDIIRSKSAYVPQQDNYCDCGIYVIHYIERFLTDPQKFIRLMAGSTDASRNELQESWQAENIKNKRSRLKLRVLNLEAITRGELVPPHVSELEEESLKNVADDREASSPSTANIAIKNDLSISKAANSTPLSSTRNQVSSPASGQVRPTSASSPTPNRIVSKPLIHMAGASPSAAPVTPNSAINPQSPSEKFPDLDLLEPPKSTAHSVPPTESRISSRASSRTASPVNTTKSISSPTPPPSTMDEDEDDDDIMVVRSTQIRHPSATRLSKRIASQHQ